MQTDLADPSPIKPRGTANRQIPWLRLRDGGVYEVSAVTIACMIPVAMQVMVDDAALKLPKN
ncbi:hypothetical protein [Paracoccus sediminilitoris]|uniref:hypothetical protein n=1 Tax=Paracoccus sediminilitoris TaxID=2202419 RepID=UPI0011B943B1|nr:hypothetical protein [Paracoccus sediminilitoris]